MMEFILGLLDALLDGCAPMLLWEFGCLVRFSFELAIVVLVGVMG